jgi:hypothetical protein
MPLQPPEKPRILSGGWTDGAFAQKLTSLSLNIRHFDTFCLIELKPARRNGRGFHRFNSFNKDLFL